MLNPNFTQELEDLKYCSGRQPELHNDAGEWQDLTRTATMVLQDELAAMRQQLELIVSGQDFLTRGHVRLENAMAKMARSSRTTSFSVETLTDSPRGATSADDMRSPSFGQECSAWAEVAIPTVEACQEPKPPPLLFSGCTGMTLTPIPEVAAPLSSRTECSGTPRSMNAVALATSRSEPLEVAQEEYISPFDTFEKKQEAYTSSVCSWDQSPVKDKLDNRRPAALSIGTDSNELAIPVPSPASGSPPHAAFNRSPRRSSRRSTVSQRQGQALFHRRRARLLRTIQVNEMVEQIEEEESNRTQEFEESSRVFKITHMEAEDVEIYLDSVMSAVIAANAVFIGINIDYGEKSTSPGINHPLQAIDVLFAIIFVTEIVVKLVLHGFHVHFCGKDRKMNIFDTILIILDASQVVFEISNPAAMNSLPSASLFRVVRLVRLVRLLRLLRSGMFKDLLAMLQGLASGAFTLGWAIILFVLMVYVTSLICREFYGRSDLPDDAMAHYFRTVPRSMFTIFRCSFGDCSALGGVPIPEHITEHYSGLSALGYCFFIFMMTIGLFNVISAIFVDSTMTAAAEHALQKRQDRLNDEHRWAGSVCGIIKKLLIACPEHGIDPDCLLEHIDKVVQVELSRDVVDEVINCVDHEHNSVVKGFLDNLDIDPSDHKRLADILDPDHSGTINMLELVEGLRRLRGEPRRSDVVSVDLMVRAMQEKLDEVFDRVVDLRQQQVQKVGPTPMTMMQVRRYYDV